jgi:hypothetical protein
MGFDDETHGDRELKNNSEIINIPINFKRAKTSLGRSSNIKSPAKTIKRDAITI